MAMTQDQLELYINGLIAIGKVWKFYKTKEWKELSAEVMKEQHNECQKCKDRHIHKAADCVHHVQWVRKHPRLALSKYYTYEGKTYRNLIALCNECHNEEHPEKGRGLKKSNKEKFLNEERW